MFVTNRQAEISSTLAMLEPGHQGWHFIQKHLMSPWFHVTLVRNEEGVECHDVVFVDSAGTLKLILDRSVESFYVKSVQLVSPGWLNGVGDWRMEVLMEVAQSKDGTSVRYTLLDGRHYFFPEPQPKTSVTYCQTIYQKLVD